MKKIYIISLIALFIIIVLGVIFFAFTFDEKISEVTETKILYENDFNREKLFLTTKSRGQNYQNVYLSTSENYNTTTSYLFDSFPIFVDKKNDSIFIYTYRKVKQPKEFNSTFNIKQIELSNLEMMNLYDSYKKDGLILIE